MYLLQRLLLLSVLLFVAGTPASAEPAGKAGAFRREAVEINPRYLLAGANGRAVSNEDFRGRFQLITFGYMYCPDICPTTLNEMAGVVGLLGEEASKLQLIFISLDPERDSPEVLKTYTAFFDSRIIALTGSPELVKRTARNFKVRYTKVINSGSGSGGYSVDHSAGMYLLGPDGQFIKKFAYGTAVNVLADEISAFIDQR